MQEFDSLLRVLETFLGSSKSGFSSNGQTQFCCPQCSEDEGVESDGKYNLEINIFKKGGTYRCWKCDQENGMYGKLSNLIKKYGGDELLGQYRNAIKDIKRTREYELIIEENDYKLDEDEEFKVKLPEKTYDFKFDGNKREAKALAYLRHRFNNHTEYFIKKYDLKYTDNYCPEPIMKGKPTYIFKNRIILPSYDKYNNLNYFTSRDYSGNSKNKYFNCGDNVEKTEIIFNENLINWDGDIVIVEGPFDHIVVPNSTLLLGKSLRKGYHLYDSIIKNSTQKIIVFLDDDAENDAIRVCNELSCYETCGRLQVVPTKKLKDELNSKKKDLNLDKLDPGKLFELYGTKGISWALKKAEEFICR